jgi:hypothetical protein
LARGAVRGAPQPQEGDHGTANHHPRYALRSTDRWRRIDGLSPRAVRGDTLKRSILEPSTRTPLERRPITATRQAVSQAASRKQRQPRSKLHVIGVAKDFEGQLVLVADHQIHTWRKRGPSVESAKYRLA